MRIDRIATALVAAFMAALATALVAAMPARAGPLLIAPTTVEFAPDRHGAAIEVTNQADEPVDLQFRAFAWSQAGADDRLAATDDLAISPPIASVAPHGRQVFRVLDLTDPAHRAAAVRERSYRLLLNELPRAGGTSVRINVQFSLPVFVTPRGAAAHATSVAGIRDIGIANEGTRRLRLATLAIRMPDGTSVALPGASSTYLLAGSARVFALPAGAIVPAGARLVGSSDAGPIDVPLPVLATR